VQDGLPSLNLHLCIIELLFSLMAHFSHSDLIKISIQSNLLPCSSVKRLVPFSAGISEAIGDLRLPIGESEALQIAG
jgi:hypothetical protein